MLDVGTETTRYRDRSEVQGKARLQRKKGRKKTKKPNHDEHGETKNGNQAEKKIRSLSKSLTAYAILRPFCKL